MTSSRHNLCLFILLKTASKVEFDSKHSDAGSKPIPYTCKCSVNDDIEMSIRKLPICTFWMTLDNYQAKITEDIRWWAKITNATNYMSIIDKDQPNHPSTSESEAQISTLNFSVVKFVVEAFT